MANCGCLQYLLPDRGDFRTLFEALQLQDCGLTTPAAMDEYKPPSLTAPAGIAIGGTAIYYLLESREGPCSESRVTHFDRPGLGGRHYRGRGQGLRQRRRHLRGASQDDHGGRRQGCRRQGHGGAQGRHLLHRHRQHREGAQRPNDPERSRRGRHRQRRRASHRCGRRLET